MISLSLGRDVNGSKVLRFKLAGERGFSVQTNGNLPKTHRMTKFDFDPTTAMNELMHFVKTFGTKRQKLLLGW